MSLFSKIFKRKKDVFNKDGAILSHAFTIGGREYLEFDTIYNLPLQRGNAAVLVYEEMRMKCTYEDLKGFVMAVNNILSGNQIKLQEITQLKKLNDNLTERINLAFDPDLVYKLASVVYFDKNESPYEYDAAYAKKKIDFWKKHKSVSDFFLQEPIQKLIPFLKLPEADLQKYLEVVENLKKIHWEEVLMLLSPEQKQHLSDNRG